MINSTIDYTPTRADSYGYVPEFEINWDMYENGLITNKAVESLLNEFEGHSKNIISREEACKYWRSNLARQGIECTDSDVEEAYTAAYGHGCEYEWECA